MSYVKLAIANAPGSNSKHGGNAMSMISATTGSLDLVKSHYQMLGRICVEYCVTIQRTDLLFTEIFQRFKESQRTEIFCELLEPYILNGKLSVVSPEVLGDFVQYYQWNLMQSGWMMIRTSSTRLRTRRYQTTFLRSKLWWMRLSVRSFQGQRTMMLVAFLPFPRPLLVSCMPSSPSMRVWDKFASVARFSIRLCASWCLVWLAQAKVSCCPHKVGRGKIDKSNWSSCCSGYARPPCGGTHKRAT